MARPTRHRNKWRIRWNDAAGKRRSAVHSEHGAALSSLRQRLAEAEAIRCGLLAQPPSDRSFGNLCDYWLEKRAPLKRRPKDDESIIRNHLRPAFGALRLQDLEESIAPIDAFRVSRAHLNPKTLHHHLTLLGTMLRLAVDLGWMRRIPRIHKPRIRLFDSDFSFLRTTDEVARFLRASFDDGPLAYAVHATAVYTGMRAGELAGLRRDSADLERRQISVQRSYDQLTKSGEVRYVPILDPLLPVLREWSLRSRGPWMFPNEAGNMLCPSARVFQGCILSSP